MVFAIEPMVNAGGPLVRMGDDGWAVYSQDGSLAAHFEFTVAVGSDGPRVLTPWHEERASRAEAAQPPRVDVLRFRRTRRGGRRGDRSGQQEDVGTVVAFGCGGLGSAWCWRWHASGAASAQAAVEPYGAHDAGGFRNVLPPGEAGVDNAAEFAAFQATGAYPDHWMDQQPLYNGLIRGAPGLTNAKIADFYKDATFGVKAGDVESTITPKPGVTIIRDSAYGIPHVYGDTRTDVMFGAGYVNAADRLFLMDILRHTGRAQLSSFVGGSAGNREMDRVQWQLAPYTDAELQRQFNLADEFYGNQGRTLQRDGQAYIAGINAYIDDALSNPSLLPAEYAGAGQDARAVERLGPDRRSVADRGHLRPRRRARGRLGADAAGARQALRHQGRPPRLHRLPRQERSRGPDHGPRPPLPLRDDELVRQARPGDPRSGLGDRLLGRAAGRGPADRVRRVLLGLRRPAAAGDPARDPRIELGAGLGSRVEDRPSDRRSRAAGRLLPAADPAGGGPARPGHRRSRGGVPGRRAVRAARPRPGLRVERDHGDERQHRHLRRGPLQGRVPLPVAGQVPGDGQAGPQQQLDAERRRPDAAGLGDA